MSDRHPKWVRVERGTVIPAGQPWRVEYPVMNPEGTEAHESVSKTVLNQSSHALDSEDAEWFVDSSWKPPLEAVTIPGELVAQLREALEFKGVWSAPLEKERYEAYRGVIDAARSLVDSVEATR